MAGSESELAPDPTAPTGTGPRGDAVVRPGVDYRSIQQPTELIQPWHIPSSGKEQEAEALSRSFSEFSKLASGLGTKVAAQSGKDAGAAAGGQPGFQPQTGLAALSTYGVEYNAAAHVTYVAHTDASVEDAISSAETSNPRDPNAFLQQASAARDATLKETPPLYQPEVSAMFDRRIAAGHARVSEQTVKGNQVDAEFAYTSTFPSRLQAAVRDANEEPLAQRSATMAAFLQKDADMRQGLVDSKTWSQKRADAVALDVQDAVQKAAHTNYAKGIVEPIMDTVRGGDVDTADKQVSAYLNDPGNSQEDKANVLVEFEHQRDEYTKFQGQLHAPEIDRIYQDLVQGKGMLAGQGAYGEDIEGRIQDMYKRGWISPEQSHALLDDARRNQLSHQQVDASNVQVDDAMHGGPKMDPADKKQVTAVDTYFRTHVLNQSNPYGTAGYAGSAVQVVQRTNIVPTSVRSAVRVGLLSNDPQQATYAAQLYDRLHTAAPSAALFDDNETKLSTLATLINDNLKTGATPEQSLALATAQVNVPPEQKKTRDEEYSSAIRKSGQGQPEQVNAAALQTRLNDAFGSFWHHAPPAPVGMRADFDQMTRQFYTQTGDLKKAQDLAGKQLLQTWGPSKVPYWSGTDDPAKPGDAQIMRYPVPEWDVPRVTQLLQDTAKANRYEGDAKGLYLTPLPGAIDPSRYFGIMYTDKAGFHEPLLGPDHRPVALDITAGKADFAAKVQAQQKAMQDQRNAEAVALARKQQAREKAQDALTPILQRMPTVIR